jgi:hypothetical protein
MKVYRNGELRGSILGHTSSSVTRANHYIGKSNWGTDENFKGMLDDLRIYDRAITASEVNTIFKGDLKIENVLGGQDPSVIVYWGDEDAGQTTDVNASSSDSWDASVNLGVLSLGEFSTGLSGLELGKTYYYTSSCNECCRFYSVKPSRFIFNRII